MTVTKMIFDDGNKGDYRKNMMVMNKMVIKKIILCSQTMT